MPAAWRLASRILLAPGLAGFLAAEAASGQVLTAKGPHPVRLSWPTNLADYRLETTTNVYWDHVTWPWSWQTWNVAPSRIGTNFVATNAFPESARFFRLYNQRAFCVSDLKQIALSFRIWQGDNGDRLPFQVPTNLGGTRELRAIGAGGFDANAFLHFQVMSNELYDPRILVCPADSTRNAATNFAGLRAENVTFQLRTSDDVQPDAPGVVLAVCPLHGNTLYCDWTVVTGTNSP